MGSGELQWKDYGPFGLLTPVANITGQGFFHCLGTNVNAGTGANREMSEAVGNLLNRKTL